MPLGKIRQRTILRDPQRKKIVFIDAICMVKFPNAKETTSADIDDLTEEVEKEVNDSSEANVHTASATELVSEEEELFKRSLFSHKKKELIVMAAKQNTKLTCHDQRNKIAIIDKIYADIQKNNK